MNKCVILSKMQGGLHSTSTSSPEEAGTSNIFTNVLKWDERKPTACSGHTQDIIRRLYELRIQYQMLHNCFTQQIPGMPLPRKNWAGDYLGWQRRLAVSLYPGRLNSPPALFRQRSALFARLNKEPFHHNPFAKGARPPSGGNDREAFTERSAARPT